MERTGWNETTMSGRMIQLLGYFFDVCGLKGYMGVTIHTHARESYRLDMSQMVRSGRGFFCDRPLPELL